MPETDINYLSWSSKIHDLVEKDSQNCFRASSIYEAGAVAHQRPELVQTTQFRVWDQELLCFNGAATASHATGSRHLGFFSEPCSSHNDTKHPVRQVGPSPDYTAIRSWLEHCRSNHTECDVGETFDLCDIYLIDVNARSLVKYPPEAEYVALSYVWGKSAPPHFDRNAMLPENLPRTIDHAITATRHLGFSYIWIDALCIDQANHADKKQQISLMDRIYEAAIATLVALDGTDADSGLGGVGTACTRIPQLFAQFGPYEALSRCPRFNSEFNQSVWSSRGWTFQEAVLSRRCVFFTRHQVVYRCESMFCSEDYHDQENFGFSRTDEHIPAWLDNIFDSRYKPSLQNTAYSLHVSTEERSDMYIKYERLLRNYRKLLGWYVVRELSDEADNLNAFSAILNRLEKRSSPGKFAGGLPLAFMRQALQWKSNEWSPEVRVQKNNDQIPSWSWAGWKLKYISILDPETLASGAAQPPFRIWTFDDVIHRSGVIIPDLNTRKEHINMAESPASMASSKETWVKHCRNPNTSSITDDWSKSSVPETAIFVEAILVTFQKRNLCIKEDDRTIRMYGIDGSSETTDHLGRAKYYNTNMIRFLQMKDSYDCIVLADNEYDGISLILLDWKDGMATRIGLLEFSFLFRSYPLNIPEILGCFDMRVARFWWV